MKAKSMKSLMSSASFGAIAALLASAPTWADPATGASALPTGGVVRAGAASIDAAAGSGLTITQSTGRAVIDWQSFNIGAGHAVTFVQPNAASATLNRVTSDAPSTLAGSLTANGSVYLVNPNGIQITASGAVSVGRGFVASTLDIANNDFMAGRDAFTGASGAGVRNSGRITTAASGFVALLGGYVADDGLIEAPLGRVGLGSGQAATLDLYGDRFLQVVMPANAADTSGAPLINLAGVVNANGGRVEIAAATARDAVRQTVNLPGSVNARAVSGQGGVIVLDGGEGGDVAVSGALNGTSVSVRGDVVEVAGALNVSGASGGRVSLDARVLIQSGAINADGETGQGGAIAIDATGAVLAMSSSTTSAAGAAGGGSIHINSAGSLFSSGAVVATSSAGVGGRIDVGGADIALVAATLDASGATGGGTIRVGGDIGTVAGLTTPGSLKISSATALSADALGKGDGGRISVWSNTRTAVSGAFTVRGGADGGNGGRVDVSSAGEVGFSGSVNSLAPKGVAGQLVLDPKFLVIVDSPPQGLGYDLLDPLPAAGNSFAQREAKTFFGDLIVVTDPTNSALAPSNGAIYIFDVRTGALRSVVTGSHDGDRIGQQFTYDLNMSPFVMTWSANWNGNRGAVTLVPLTGAPLSGVVSSANSLVGGTAGDAVGSEVGNLGNFLNQGLLFGSPNWTNPATGASGAGAVTYIPAGVTSLSGVVGPSNSLVGVTADDRVGAGVGDYYFGSAFGPTVGRNVTRLANGDFVIATPTWGAGAAAPNAGAVTLFRANTPTVGALSAANSLVGSSAGSKVGSGGFSVNAAGGYGLVLSPSWGNGTTAQVGAVTWINLATGLTGTVSASNSLVGSTTGDGTDLQVSFLTGNNNYLVRETSWTNPTGSAARAGEVTFGAGATGVSGIISAANSLVGTSTDDHVGQVILKLANGAYAVVSPRWRNPTTSADLAGAVTWGSGATGVAGAISAANSVVGVSAFDFVGGFGKGFATGSPGGPYNYPATVYALTGTSNYIILSNNWNGGAGAVTWVNGGTGQTMTGSNVISAANSLIGAAAGDQISRRYYSVNYNNLTDSFSPLGSSTQAVGLTLLPNGNYVIDSQAWSAARGAVTFGNGASGTAGVVGAANSVVGSTPGDYLGFINDPNSVGAASTPGMVVFQGRSDYLIFSSLWHNGSVAKAGAITFVNGTTGLPIGGNGPVSAVNSLVGTQANDLVGLGAAPPASGLNSGVPDSYDRFANGRIIAFNPNWANGSAVRAGAVTIFDPLNPGATVGAISSANSLIGQTAEDRVGGGPHGFSAFGSPFYLLATPNWTNVATGAARAGAVTILNPDVVTTGLISAANSVIGTHTDDRVGSSNAIGYNPWVGLNKYALAPPFGSLTADPTFFNFALTEDKWNGGRGAVTVIRTNGSSWTTLDGSHEISAANSLVGSTPDVAGDGGDHVGGGKFNAFSGLTAWGSSLIVASPSWNGARGAVTVIDSTTGMAGVVSNTNSLVGSQVGDKVGSTIGLIFPDYSTLFTAFTVNSTNWANGSLAGAGAVTFMDAAHPKVGAVSQANSLVGDQAGEHVGSGGVVADIGPVIISTPGYKNSAGVGVGALTVLDPLTGEPLDSRNIVGTGNSIVGTSANPSGLSYEGPFFQGGTVFGEPVSNTLFIARGAGNQLTVGITTPPQVRTVDFGLAPNSTMYIPPGVIANLLRTGNVQLAASTDLSLLSDLTVNNPAGDGGVLSLSAGRSLILNGSIFTDNGDLHLVANDTAAHGASDANRDSGDAVVSMGSGVTINAGAGNVVITVANGAGRTNTAGGAITLGSITAGSIHVSNDAPSPSSGAVILSVGARLTASQPGDAIVISGSAFTNHSDALALANTGGGRFLVYSHDWDADTRGGLSGANLYNRTFANSPPSSLNVGNVFVFSRQPLLTVTGQDASRAYGDANPAFSAAIAGLVNGDSASYAYSGQPTVGSLATTGSDAGNYSITPTTGSLGSTVGYGFKFVDGTLTISARAVTAIGVAADNKTKVYGQADPTLTYAITAGSLFSGDHFTGALARDAGENVGDYAIRQGTLALSSNYTLTFVNGQLTITPATLTYVANAASRAYGDAPPTFGGAVTGFVAGDTLTGATTGTLAFTATAASASNVGAYAINGAGLTANHGNYVFVQAASNATALTVTRRSVAIGVAADNKSKTYGAADPTLTYAITGGSLVGSDTFTGALSRDPGENVGLYAINQGSLALSTNYTLAFVNGRLTITPATLTYAASAATRAYGEANPVFSGTVSGFQSSDTLANATTGTLTFTSPATGQSLAGTYAINGSGLTASNYVFAQDPANATALTITAAAAASRSVRLTLHPFLVDFSDPNFGDTDPETGQRAINPVALDVSAVR